MKRITVDQLAAIFCSIERDENEYNLETIVAYLDGKNIDEDIVTILLNGDSLVKKFFSSQVGLPASGESLVKFKETGVYTAKLSLLSIAVNKLGSEPKHELLKVVIGYCKQILNLADSVFKDNNLNAQLYLLNKLSVLCTKNFLQNEPALSNILSQTIQSLFELSCRILPDNEATRHQLPALVGFVRLAQNNPKLCFNIDWQNNFISASKKYFEKKDNYNDKLLILEGLYKSWELIKDSLNLQDIDWLMKSSQNINRQYSQLPSRFQALNGEVNQFLRQFWVYRASLLAVMTIIGPLTFSSIYLSLISVRQKRVFLMALQKINSMGPEEKATYMAKYTEEQIEADKKLVQAMAKLYRIDDIYNVDRELQETSYTEMLMSIYPYFLFALIPIGILVYKATTFFGKPAETRPMPLPDWVSECKQKFAPSTF